MSTYTLTDPMIITSRLMPGIRIGDATISIEPEEIRASGIGGTDRLHFRYIVDIPTMPAHEGTDLSAPWCGSEPTGDDVRRMLGSLLAFLENDGERYASRMRGYDDGDPYSFGADLAEWAYAHIDEIAVAACYLECDDE